MNSKAIIAIVAVVIVVAAGSAAIVVMNNNKSSGEDITLILGTTEDTGPISTASNTFYEQRRMIVQEPLIGFGYETTYTKLTADTYTTEDNITWNVKLKSDIVWSDGEPYTTDDVKHTYEIYKIGRPTVVANIDSVVIVDDLNMKFVLAAAGDLAGIVSNMPVLPWHIWKDIPVATAEDYQKVTSKDAFIGTGSYKVDSLNSAGDELTYVYNDNYRDGKPNVTKIIFKHYGVESAMVAALLAGEIDAVYNYGTPGISASYVDEVKKSDKVDYMTVVTGGVPVDVLFNMRNSISADSNFRNAFKYAVDYDQLIQYLAPATGANANSGLIPNTIDGYVDTERLAKDSTKAENYMKAYFTAHSLDWSTDKVDVSVAVFGGDLYTNAFTLLKEQLAAINVNLTSIDYGAASNFAPTARQSTTAVTLFMMTDAAIKAYAGYASFYVGANGTLKMVYGAGEAENAEYEAIVTAMNSASTEAAKMKCASDFQKFYEANSVAIPLYWGGFVQPYSNSYEGWKCGSSSGLLCYENLFGLEKA